MKQIASFAVYFAWWFPLESATFVAAPPHVSFKIFCGVLPLKLEMSQRMHWKKEKLSLVFPLSFCLSFVFFSRRLKAEAEHHPPV